MTAAPGTSQSDRIGKSYSASPCPGPSTAKVATPRSRNNCSVVPSSSFAESRPGTRITTGCGPGDRGARSTPTIRPFSKGSPPFALAGPHAQARPSDISRRVRGYDASR